MTYKRYKIVGRYVAGSETTGYHLVELINGFPIGTGEKVTRERVVYHAARGEIVNCNVFTYENTVQLRGVECVLSELPVYNEVRKGDSIKSNNRGIYENRDANKLRYINSPPYKGQAIKIDVILNELGFRCINDLQVMAIQRFIASIAGMMAIDSIAVTNVMVRDDYTNKDNGYYVDQSGVISCPKIITIGFRKGLSYISINISTDIVNRNNTIICNTVGNSGYNKINVVADIPWFAPTGGEYIIKSNLVELVSRISYILTDMEDKRKEQRKVLIDAGKLPKRPTRPIRQ